VKTPGAILLVACYELGHQPLAVAWPVAFLERAGFAPSVLDLSVEPFDAEKVRRARLVAISVPMHTALRVGVVAAERVRAVNPTCHVCFYGLYAALNADHLLDRGADSVLAGEAEQALVELAISLEQEPARVRPAATAQSSAQLVKLDFPTPRRAQLPSLKRYAHIERAGRQELAGYVEASRGCLHLCRHCPIPPVYGGRFFVVPRAVVLGDVRQQVEAGATHITFGDPDFLNGPGHALALARALHAEFPSLTFDITAKVEHLQRHRDRLPDLASLGCAFIVTAAESLNETVLSHLAKGHTRADLVQVLAAARAAGIPLRPTWVPFTPWSTLADYRELLDFIEAEDLVDAVDPVQLSIRLLIPPGSPLVESPAMRPYLGELVSGDFYYRWAHPDPAMERLHAEVTGVVAKAAQGKEEALTTFDRIRRLADQMADAPERPALAVASPSRPRGPRLTEPWFC
jgi:radical SAM superfamily enzyme YgiQ (UPF0313 family)